MEDMSVEYEVLDQTTGISFDDQNTITQHSAGMHATFWESDLLQEPSLSSCKDQNGKASTYWWVNSTEKYLKDRSTAKTYFDLLKDGTGVDVLEGDTKFKYIDWQTSTTGPPGCEMPQMLHASMSKLSDYDRLPEMIDNYIKTLHAKNPATKSYTRAMLMEDWFISEVTWMYMLVAFLYPIISSQPRDSSLWQLLKPGYERGTYFTKTIGLTTWFIKWAKEKGYNA